MVWPACRLPGWKKTFLFPQQSLLSKSSDPHSISKLRVSQRVLRSSLKFADSSLGNSHTPDVNVNPYTPSTLTRGSEPHKRKNFRSDDDDYEHEYAQRWNWIASPCTMVPYIGSIALCAILICQGEVVNVHDMSQQETLSQGPYLNQSQSLVTACVPIGMTDVMTTNAS